MRVNKKEADLLNDAIDQWQDDGIVDEQAADKMRRSIESNQNDLGSYTFYAFVAAVSSAILAFGAIVLDEKWIERMRAFFAFSELLIGVMFAALTVFFSWYAHKRKLKFPTANLSNESFNMLIALSTGVAITYLARSIGKGYAYYGLAIFIITILYFAIAIYLHSQLLWVCALLAFITCFAVQTYSWSAPEHHYFLGMNYPLRTTLFGLLLLIIIHTLRENKFFQPFHIVSNHFCWSFFLLSALILSVSGNLTYELWSAIRQGKLVIWAIGYTLLLCALVVYAYKLKDEFFRDIVILFFLLNIYTRYFEYFWDKTNKGIFFAILALSFWLIGAKTETMRKKFME